MPSIILISAKRGFKILVLRVGSKAHGETKKTTGNLNQHATKGSVNYFRRKCAC